METKPKDMYHWDWDEWDFWLTKASLLRKRKDEPITDKQKIALENLYVPDAVIARLNRREARHVITVRLEETKNWIEQQQIKEAQATHCQLVSLPHFDWL